MPSRRARANAIRASMYGRRPEGELRPPRHAYEHGGYRRGLVE